MVDTATGAGASEDAKKQKPSDYVESATKTTQRPDEFFELGNDNDDENDAALGFADEAGELMELMGTVKSASNLTGGAEAAHNMLVFAELPAAKPVGGDGKPSDKVVDPKVKDYDQRFDGALSRLDKAIESAKSDSTKAATELKTSQTRSLELFEGIGKERASAKDAKSAGPKELQLENSARTIESGERKLVDGLPSKARDLQVLKGCFLISSGKDAEIRAGEKLLAEMVRDNPSLGVDEKFHESVLRAYTEMTSMRALRGNGEWKSTLRLDDVLPQKKPSDPAILTGPSASELLKTASQTFFDGGIEKALPQFERARERADLDLNSADRKRVAAFIEALRQDSNIAFASAQNKDVTELANARAELIGTELDTHEKSRQASQLNTAIGVNAALAKIASPGPERFAEGKRELAAFLEKNPAMRFNDDFKHSVKNAFKAHYTEKTATAPSQPIPPKATKPTETAAAQPRNSVEIPDVKVDPAYKPLSFTQESFVKASEDKEVQPYGVDTATTIGLYAFSAGLGIASFVRVRNQIRAAREAKVLSEAAHTVSNLNGLTEQPLYQKGDKAYEVKGKASDGRIILQDKSLAQESGPVEPPYKEVVSKDFNPRKAKFAEFTPMKLGEKSYYADSSGTVFEYSGGSLKETADTRKLSLIDETKYAGDQVSQAIRDTSPAQMDKMLELRTQEKRMGSYWEKVGDGAIDAAKLKASLATASWKPYNPLDASGNPLVKPPARAFRAEMDGGHTAMVNLEALAPGETFSLVDAKGVGIWSLVADRPDLKGEKVGFATMIVGPDMVDGKPTGKEVVWSVHPGDPLAPSSVNDQALYDKHQVLSSQGKSIAELQKELSAPQYGTERRISGITLEQAKALGFSMAKLEALATEQSRPAGETGASAVDISKIQAGLDYLEKTGQTELARQIRELKEAGKLPSRIEAYMSPSGAARLADSERLANFKQLVSEARSALGSVSAPATMGDTAVESRDGRPVTTGERHDTLSSTDKTLASNRAHDLMVTVSFTGSDGVTTIKKVSLLDVPAEELGKRLSGLSEEKLASEIRTTEEKIRLAESEKRSADLEALKSKLTDLEELRTMREAYEGAKKGGKDAAFLAETQARAKSGSGRGALGALAKTGAATALLLLFNELVPDVNLSSPRGSQRVLPGSSGG